ncbi:uncharacterized protein G2W53_024414 [Senna tora]|uniref:Uncharacterized protein n=1 Tax=Senna tora TaxID=362788 RepID=A0A834WJ20_9FABA|nr:uncharacterized protein G2W53_024414 [Senna tora]
MSFQNIELLLASALVLDPLCSPNSLRINKIKSEGVRIWIFILALVDHSIKRNRYESSEDEEIGKQKLITVNEALHGQISRTKNSAPIVTLRSKVGSGGRFRIDLAGLRFMFLHSHQLGMNAEAEAETEERTRSDVSVKSYAIREGNAAIPNGDDFILQRIFKQTHRIQRGCAQFQSALCRNHKSNSGLTAVQQESSCLLPLSPSDASASWAIASTSACSCSCKGNNYSINDNIETKPTVSTPRPKGLLTPWPWPLDLPLWCMPGSSLPHRISSGEICNQLCHLVQTFFPINGSELAASACALDERALKELRLVKCLPPAGPTEGYCADFNEDKPGND